MSVIPTLISRLSTVPVKMLTGFLVEISKLILKCKWKLKGPRIYKGVFKKEKNLGSVDQEINFAFNQHKAPLGRLDFSGRPYVSSPGMQELRTRALEPDP